MSTGARIGVQMADGTVRSVHVWRDGYPDTLGVTLAKHYNSEEKAYALIALGDLIDVMASLDKCRLEKNSKPRTYKTFAAYQREMENDIYYKYIFRDGKWGNWEVGA